MTVMIRTKAISARASQAGRRWTYAEMVAEVLSPGSRRRDRFDKRDLYEQHGVREYWIIDPEALTVEVLHLHGGKYRLAGNWHSGERAESRLL